MNTPFLTWMIIIAAMILLFVVNAIVSLAKADRSHNNHRLHVIEIGKEKDLFFIPGDSKNEKYKDFEYDDVEDL